MTQFDGLNDSVLTFSVVMILCGPSSKLIVNHAIQPFRVKVTAMFLVFSTGKIFSSLIFMLMGEAKGAHFGGHDGAGRVSQCVGQRHSKLA